MGLTQGQAEWTREFAEQALAVVGQALVHVEQVLAGLELVRLGLEAVRFLRRSSCRTNRLLLPNFRMCRKADCFAWLVPA